MLIYMDLGFMKPDDESQTIAAINQLIRGNAIIELSFVFLEKKRILTFSEHLSQNIDKYLDYLDIIIAAMAINRQLGYLPKQVLESLAKVNPWIVRRISYLPDVILLVAYIYIDQLDSEAEKFILKTIEEYPILCKPYIIPLFSKHPQLAEKAAIYGGFITPAALYALGSTYNKNDFIRFLKRIKGQCLVDTDAIIRAIKNGYRLNDALEEAGIDMVAIFRDVLNRPKIPVEKLKLSETTITALYCNTDDFVLDKEFSCTANIIGALFKSNKDRERAYQSVSVFLSSPILHIKKTALETIIQLYTGTGNLQILTDITKFIRENNKELRNLAIKGILHVYKDSYNDIRAARELLNYIDGKEFDEIRLVATVVKKLFEESPKKEEAMRLLEEELKQKNTFRVATAMLAISYLKEGEQDKQIKDRLLKYYRHDDITLRCAAISALGSLYAHTGNMEIFKLLKENYNSKDKNIQIATAKAIGAIFRGTNKDLSLLDEFYPHIKSTDELKRNFAVNIIISLFKGSGRELDALTNLRKHFDEAYLHIRKAYTHIIIEILKDSGKELDAIKLLLPLFEDKSKYTRGIASELIGLLVRNAHLENECLPLFNNYLRRGDKYARRAALRVFGHIYNETANKEAGRLVKQYLKDPDPGVRVTSAKVIYKIFRNTNNDDIIKVTIEPLLEDDAWYVKATAKQILSKISA